MKIKSICQKLHPLLGERAGVRAELFLLILAMLITTPLPFTQAMSLLAHKDLLPTNMSSAELKTLSAIVRERSLFSARTLLTDYLAEIKSNIEQVVNPSRQEGVMTGDYATARLALKEKLDSLAYQPEPGEEGTIKDLRSDPRLNLVLRTNVEMAQGYGNWRQGQDPEILDQWPAQELFRAESRDVPRGSKREHGAIIADPENSWQSRWNEAGAASGREDGWTAGSHKMIALKNHPIWDMLGSSELFDDGLDNPYPPFAFNSGMDVRDVDREEAVSLGLLGEEEQVEPQIRPFELLT